MGTSEGTKQLFFVFHEVDTFLCLWFSGHLWPGTGRELFSPLTCVISEHFWDWLLGKDVDSSLNVHLGSGKMAELNLEVLCLHCDMWYPTDVSPCTHWVFHTFASEKQSPWEVWDMKYFCFVKAARLRWGEEAGSFIREVRPGYPLLLCRVFTQRAWSDTETVELFCWRSPTEPMCFTVSDTDHTLFCSVEAASIGFVIVIDRRRDKWSSVKASLTRIAVNIYFCALL